MGKLTYSFLGKVSNLIDTGTFSDTKPIISQISERFNVQYSVSGITKLVKRLGFTYKEKVELPSKLDNDKQLQFVKDYEFIQDNLTDECAIFFMYAVHPQHNTHSVKAWLRKGKTIGLPKQLYTNK